MSSAILAKGQYVDHKYLVDFFLKKGNHAEFYRVRNENKEFKFLKLFEYSKLHRNHFTVNGDILEIEILRQTRHPNLIKYNDSGDIVINNQKYKYAILDFVSGESLADRLKRGAILDRFEAKNIILSILNGLQYLHHKQIILNDITAQNVMLDLSGKVPILKIIDFAYARFLMQSNKSFIKEGLNPFYTANEIFNNVFLHRVIFILLGHYTITC